MIWNFKFLKETLQKKGVIQLHVKKIVMIYVILH